MLSVVTFGLIPAVGKLCAILPRLNEEINEEWISDKTRFAYDGLKQQRLDHPYIRKNGKLTAASWEEAFLSIKKNLEGLASNEIAALAGDQADCEAMIALKDLMTKSWCPPSRLSSRWNPLGYPFKGDLSVQYHHCRIEQADLILLIATNPRLEAPLINARIRKRYLMGGFAKQN